jgi:hypothetical protein
LDKVFSARLDVAAIEELTRAAKRLGMTKKEFLESAIRLRVRQVEDAQGSDVWDETSGAWEREEPVETTRKRSRSAFEKGYQRHHKKRR